MDGESPRVPYVRLRDVFAWPFWLNYALVVLVSLPIPILRVEVNGELVRRVLIYQCYLRLFQGKWSATTVEVVLAHAGLTFAITALVWYWVFRLGVRQAATGAENGEEA